MLQTLIKAVFNVRARVSRGAALLDRCRPGWAECIHIDRLNLADNWDCVFGQLYGYYPRGRETVGLHLPDESCRHGFIASVFSIVVFPRLRHHEDACLRDAWVVAIRERIEQAGRERRLRVRILLGSGPDTGHCRCQSATSGMPSHNLVE